LVDTQAVGTVLLSLELCGQPYVTFSAWQVKERALSRSGTTHNQDATGRWPVVFVILYLFEYIGLIVPPAGVIFDRHSWDVLTLSRRIF